MQPAIFNAGAQTIGQGLGPTPNMRSTLAGWVRELSLSRVVKTAVDFEIVEREVAIPGAGVWQPLSNARLAIKPEGQRSWRWFMIHATTDLKLNTDDVFTRAGTKYRVMANGEWDDNGFRLYEVVNDYDSRASTSSV